MGTDAGGLAAQGLAGTDKLPAPQAEIKHSCAALENKWLDTAFGATLNMS